MLGSKVYHVHSLHRTLQGEGRWSGRKVILVRFTSCNIWDGLEEHRERDSQKGLCAKICDTRFRGLDQYHEGGTYEAKGLRQKAKELYWQGLSFDTYAQPIVLFTGGEPSLQLTTELVCLFLEQGWRVHVETNGSRPLPQLEDEHYWITLSPKPPMPVALEAFDEIKVLYPLFDPRQFEPLIKKANVQHRYVQPVDGEPGAISQCVEFIMRHPSWALSLQSHKYLSLP